MKELFLRKLIRKILNESNERVLGTCLSNEIKTEFITIYRACAINEFSFKDKDYITLNKNFALEHSESSHIYHEEPQHVIKAIVSTNNVFNAYNPGEYFYSGKEKKGNEVYVTKGEEYEGLPN